MPHAHGQGIRVHYQVEGQGPPLVLHHGLGGSLEAWRQLGCAADFRDNYRVIMLDARGHGASDKPHNRADYGLVNHVADVVIGGAHPYADHSYVDAFGQLDGTDSEAFLAALERVLDEPVPVELRPRLLANDLRALTAAAAQPRPSLEGVLHTMAMPCLLVVGEADSRRAAVEQCAKQTTHATLVTLPGLNHVATLGRRDAVLPPVIRFLAAQRESDRNAPEVS